MAGIVACADGINGTNGVSGTNGTSGSICTTGIATPADTVGVDGDMFINSITGDVYRKIAGVWTLQLTLVVAAAPPPPRSPPPPPPAPTQIAVEGGSFSVPANTVVTYGADPNRTSKTISGAGTCTNATFGADPAPGVVKACYAVVAAPPPPRPAPPAPPAPSDIMQAGGMTVDTAKYAAMAANMVAAGGVAYRFGAGTATAGTATTWAAAPNNTYPPSSRFTNMTWQVGSYIADEGDYSTTMGQVSWVPDSPATALGVSTLEFLAQRSNTFSEAPQASWVWGGASDDQNTKNYYKALMPSGMPTNPVAMGRSYARLTWAVQTVMAFQNGLLGVTGSNTANNRCTAQLDAGKVPTAVAVTNGGEFALVTVWDTINLKGQVAVVALAGGCQDCPGGHYWGEWLQTVPGLPNLGNILFMKVVGYVDLPGMMAPTDISVTTGLDNETLQRVYPPAGGPFTTHELLPLTTEANRQTFMPGGVNYGTYPHGGVAVVVSKSERKVMFVNLKPLFDYYQSMYFGTLANFNQTTTVGQAANQWPFAFSVAPSQAPTIIKTVSLGKRPTAVKASLYSTQRAWIATEDGTLQIYSLGNYALNGAAVPADIALKGSVAIGKNPTSLGYVKHDPAYRSAPTTMNDNVLVVARGSKKIQWVHFNSDNNSGFVQREMQDSRLKDPVWAEDADNHGTEAYVLTIADYEGKQVMSYRYGPVVYHTNATGTCQEPGCGMVRAFEFGGSFPLPGKPFQLTGANVP